MECILYVLNWKQRWPLHRKIFLNTFVMTEDLYIIRVCVICFLGTQQILMRPLHAGFGMLISDLSAWWYNGTHRQTVWLERFTAYTSNSMTFVKCGSCSMELCCYRQQALLFHILHCCGMLKAGHVRFAQLWEKMLSYQKDLFDWIMLSVPWPQSCSHASRTDINGGCVGPVL